MLSIDDDDTYLDEDGQDGKYQTRIRRHRLTRFYRIALIIILAAAVFAALAVQYNNKVYSSYEISASSVRENISSADTSLALDGTVLTYSSDGIQCCDSKGNALWNQTFEMQNPVVTTCEDTAAVGDYDGKTIYVVDKDGVLGQISTGYPIKSLSVASNGVVAAVMDDSDITWIYVYDTAGNTLLQFRTSMAQSGYPLHVCLSPDGILLAVSYLYVDSGSIKSSVAFYNFGEVGQNQQDNYVSGYDYADYVIPEVQFLDNSDVFAVADGRLMFYSGSQKPVMKSEVLIKDEIQGVFYGGNFAGLVTPDTTGAHKYILNVYGTEGTSVFSTGLDMDYKNIVITNNSVIIYNDTDCLIYSISGKKKFSGTIDGTIELILPGKDMAHLTAVTQEAVEEITLK